MAVELWDYVYGNTDCDASKGTRHPPLPLTLSALPTRNRQWKHVGAVTVLLKHLFAVCLLADFVITFLLQDEKEED